MTRKHVEAKLCSKSINTKWKGTYVTSARKVSPILPPEFMYVTLRSVETPVAKSPFEATANEPPRSTVTGAV